MWRRDPRTTPQNGEFAAERAKLLDKESGELEEQANRFAEEIKELDGEGSSRIS